MNENTTLAGFLGDKKMRILFVIILIALALLFIGKAFSEFKSIQYIGEEAGVRSTITVSGEGEVAIAPDTAQFSFGVAKEAKEVASAQKQVTTAMNGLLEYLESYGIEEKDIKTTSYTISPRYEYRERLSFPSTGERVLVGYEVSQRVEVSMKELDGLGEVIGELGGRGATNISNVRFTVEDEDEVKAQAREEAIKDAREKAKILARDLGVRLGRVVSFHETGGPIYNDYYEERTYAVDSRGGGTAPQIPAGENEIRVNVNVSYSID